MTITATGFVDASGDATLTWLAGLPCRESASRQVFGTQMVVLENIVEDKHPERTELTARMTEKAAKYDLKRTTPVSFVIPGRGIAVLNMTHTDTPLEPLAAARSQLEGKAQADLAVKFPQGGISGVLRQFARARLRQSRHSPDPLDRRPASTDASMKSATARKFDDAIGRTAWPVELHDSDKGYVWQTFPEDHVHYIPLGSLTPADADNIVAAGRCIDADLAALSSVRVMGPCIAMGAAAAQALDLAGSGSVHQIDIKALQEARARQHRAQGRAGKARHDGRRQAAFLGGAPMKLTDAEQAMYDGHEGPAKQKAMDLLMRYGEALGAERLVETNNVAGAFNASTPSVRELVARRALTRSFPNSISTARRSCRFRKWR